ncbi:MAG: response regulator [Deferrisomatales bacterium]
MIRVLVVDDHAVVREGIKRIVDGTQDIEAAGEAASGEEALDRAARGRFDVVLLDIAMPGRSWLDTLRQLHTQHPGLPVLILSVHPEEQYAVRALKAGAAGYLNKAGAPEELVQAIRAVVRGRKYVTAALAQALVAALGDRGERPPHERLSDREHEVLRRLAAGQPVGEIAQDLCLSPKTVSTYRTRLLRKLAAKTNADLTHYALRHGLIELSGP